MTLGLNIPLIAPPPPNFPTTFASSSPPTPDSSDQPLASTSPPRGRTDSSSSWPEEEHLPVQEGDVEWGLRTEGEQYLLGLEAKHERVKRSLVSSTSSNERDSGYSSSGSPLLARSRPTLARKKVVSGLGRGPAPGAQPRKPARNFDYHYPSESLSVDASAQMGMGLESDEEGDDAEYGRALEDPSARERASGSIHSQQPPFRLSTDEQSGSDSDSVGTGDLVVVRIEDDATAAPSADEGVPLLPRPVPPPQDYFHRALERSLASVSPPSEADLPSLFNEPVPAGTYSPLDFLDTPSALSPVPNSPGSMSSVVFHPSPRQTYREREEEEALVRAEREEEEELRREWDAKPRAVGFREEVRICGGIKRGRAPRGRSSSRGRAAVSRVASEVFPQESVSRQESPSGGEPRPRNASTTSLHSSPNASAIAVANAIAGAHARSGSTGSMVFGSYGSRGTGVATSSNGSIAGSRPSSPCSSIYAPLARPSKVCPSPAFVNIRPRPRRASFQEFLNERGTQDSDSDEGEGEEAEGSAEEGESLNEDDGLRARERAYHRLVEEQARRAAAKQAARAHARALQMGEEAYSHTGSAFREPPPSSRGGGSRRSSFASLDERYLEAGLAHQAQNVSFWATLTSAAFWISLLDMLAQGAGGAGRRGGGMYGAGVVRQPTRPRMRSRGSSGSMGSQSGRGAWDFGQAARECPVQSRRSSAGELSGVPSPAPKRTIFNERSALFAPPINSLQGKHSQQAALGVGFSRGTDYGATGRRATPAPLSEDALPPPASSRVKTEEEVRFGASIWRRMVQWHWWRFKASQTWTVLVKEVGCGGRRKRERRRRRSESTSSTSSGSGSTREREGEGWDVLE